MLLIVEQDRCIRAGTEIPVIVISYGADGCINFTELFYTLKTRA
jgi:hypothetical protein